MIMSTSRELCCEDLCHTSDGRKKILDDQIGMEDNKRINPLLEDGFRKAISKIPALQNVQTNSGIDYILN